MNFWIGVLVGSSISYSVLLTIWTIDYILSVSEEIKAKKENKNG